MLGIVAGSRLHDRPLTRAGGRTRHPSPSKSGINLALISDDLPAPDIE